MAQQDTPDAPNVYSPSDVDALIKSVRAIADPSIRTLSLGRQLSERADHEVISTLEALRERSIRGSEAAKAVLIDLSRLATVRVPDGPGLLARWETAARATGSSTLSMLSDQRPQLVSYAPHGLDINEHFEDTPLGRRKTMAKSRDRQVLDRLLFDKHPDVVALLLANSRLIERDVVRMAASRPTSAQALDTIARHPKWLRRYAVRAAIVQNPYSSPALATRLLATLNLNEIRRVANNLKVHETVRSQARLLAAERGVKVKGPRKLQTSSEVDIAQADEQTSDGLVASILAQAMATVSARGAAGSYDEDAQEAPDAPSKVDTPTDHDTDDDLAALFLANLGPLTLTPVSEDGSAPTADPKVASLLSAPLRTTDLDESDFNVEVVAVDLSADEPTSAADSIPDLNPHPGPKEVEALAARFLENLTIELVPVTDES